MFLIRFSFFQNKISKEFTNYLSSEINSDIRLEEVSLNGFSNLQLNKIFIPDLNGDTVLFVPKVVVDIQDINWLDRKFIINQVIFKDAEIVLRKNPGKKKYEIEFLLNSFKKNQRESKDYQLLINQFKIENSQFYHLSKNSIKEIQNIDIQNFKINKLNLLLNNISLDNNLFFSKISDVKFQHEKGFNISSLNADLYLDSTKFNLVNLKLKTPNSIFNSDNININLDFRNDFIQLENIETQLSSVDYNLFFNKKFDSALNFNFSTDFSGSSSSIKLEDFSLIYQNSSIEGDFEIKDFSNKNLVSYFFNVESNTILVNDLISLQENINLKIPPLALKQLEKINNFDFQISGNGNNDEIKSNLEFVSSTGEIIGNLHFFKNNSSEIFYHFNIDAKKISGISLLDNKNNENFNAHFEIDGKGLYKQDVDLKINGYLSDFTYNDYKYEDLNITGAFKNKSFIGQIELIDKFIHLDFNGYVDLNNPETEFDFSMDIKNAFLGKIGFLENHPDGVASFKTYLNGFGNDWKDFTGFANMEELVFVENGETYNFGNIDFDSQSNNYNHILNFNSDFVSFNISGDFKFDQLNKDLNYLFATIFPNLSKPSDYFPSKQYVDFDLEILDFTKLSAVFFPSLDIAKASNLRFSFNGEKELLDFSLNSNKIQYDDFILKNLNLDIKDSKDIYLDSNLKFILSVGEFVDNNIINFQNIELQTTAKNNIVNTSLVWNNNDSISLGKLSSIIDFKSSKIIFANLEEFYLFDTSVGYWNMQGNPSIKYMNDKYFLDSILLSNANQTIILNGNIGREVIDSLSLEIQDFQLSSIPFLFGFNQKNTTMEGILNAQINFQSLLYNPQLFNEFNIDNFIFNFFPIGNLNFHSLWVDSSNKFILDGGLVNENNHKEIQLIDCYFYPNNDKKLDGIVKFDSTNIDFLSPFLPNTILSNLQGLLYGDLSISGDPFHPKFNGDLSLYNGELKLTEYDTRFKVNGNLLVKDDAIEISNGNFLDELNNIGTINGNYHHDNFIDYSLNISLEIDQPIMVMNNSFSENPYYYGKVFMTGSADISYDSIENLSIYVNAITEEGSSLNIPLYGSSEVVLHDFISFINKDTNSSETIKKPIFSKEKMNIDIDLEITDQAEVKLIFDDLVGDEMKSSGQGNIQLNIDQNYDLTMYGNYVINEGEYVFTLKDFINKKFDLIKGGTLTWLGDPYNAKIDMSARYPLRTSLYNIMPEIERENWKHKSMVDVDIELENNLMNPDIKFNIDVPNGNESVKTALKRVLSNTEELNKQVFSLLILNQFITPNHLNLGNNVKSYDISTSEVLSNQLGNMISSFTDEFDIGFNYTLGNQLSNEELSVAMSTQQFNDRLTVETNLGMSQSNSITQNPNSFIGDVNIEYKLNSKGNIRVHAYNKSNEYDLSNQNQSNYTQGFGLFYKQSFDSLGELFCEMNNLFKSKDNKCHYCEVKELRKTKGIID
ncbi:MAG: translocation/assembly module TamB domain-containing protein [Flavobacteriales bacterium]